IEARQNGISTDKDLTVHVESYINHFNVHKNTAYEALKSACDNLFERRFSYQKRSPKGNLEIVKSRWIQRISYVDKEALVRLKFSDDVVPLITNLERHFTSYELEQVSRLTSVYAIRLYELLIAWRSTGTVPIIELLELRAKLGVEDGEHKRINNFKKIVLDLALHQINQHTDITATYEQHKRGRVIVGFSFKFKHKKPKDIETAKNTGDNTAKKKPRRTTIKSLRSRLEKSGIAL
ncbi:MAG: replication initiation protein RepM, partial [Candidatus Nitrosoglobus sp.]